MQHFQQLVAGHAVPARPANEHDEMRCPQRLRFRESSVSTAIDTGNMQRMLVMSGMNSRRRRSLASLRSNVFRQRRIRIEPC